MSHLPSTISSNPPTNSNRWFVWTWLAWSVAQVVVLGLFAGRVSLSPRIPAPIEQFANCGMGLAQVGLAALLGPILCRRLNGVMMAAGVALPMLMLATLLSGQRAVDAIGPCFLVCSWLICLHGLCAGLREKVGNVTYAMTLLIGVGSPILCYLSAEYGDGSQSGWQWVSPGIALCFANQQHAFPWPGVVIPAVLALMTQLLLLVARRVRHTIPSPSAPTATTRTL